MRKNRWHNRHAKCEVHCSTLLKQNYWNIMQFFAATHGRCHIYSRDLHSPCPSQLFQPMHWASEVAVAVPHNLVAAGCTAVATSV